ncbi:hypothetical protein HF086_011627 [Spodoptera exigua]|uniref:Cyclin A n=1 Tax=Spodoptera exigua TaxID=7107 RepID=A0A922MSA7_SPOEX|nr:hypothetical protein HF086_011627 [Spodoptera exigua]
MAFRIHEDQENASLGLRKDSADVFANQRRALGDLSQFACNQSRNLKLPGLTNGPCKVQDENRTMRQIKNEKNIVPPVAQFRAFSVYEDKPTEAEVKKREHTFKPFVAKDTKKDSIFVSNESTKTLCLQAEKKPDRLIEPPSVRPVQEKKNVVESPMSVVDTSVLSMSISKNESQIIDDEDDDTTTAQTDREMFFHVVEYRQDIYEYMKEIEAKNRANPRYMRKQPDITHMMRSILIDWLVEVCDEYNQQSETLHLAVSYVDRFLSYMSVVRTKLQLVGTAATYIAAKYEEVYPPEVSEFVYITDDTYTKREYLAELCLLEADPYLQFKPSIIAASALATARHCLLCERCTGEDCEKRDPRDGKEARPHANCSALAWPAALVTCSGYSLADLDACLRELARTHSHASLQPYQAVPDKYKSNKFDGVSTIEPRPMFPVPKYQPPAPANSARPADNTRSS